jgi:predicted O-methyltransferase YrrM
MFHPLHRYFLRVTPPRPPVLADMEKLAEKTGFPIIGPLCGRFLFQMATLTKAKRVLELGSGYGYSAFWFALAMGKRGKIILTDKDPANKKRALDFHKRAKLTTEFDFRVGNALDIAKRMRGPFDIILNDIDKLDYPKTIDLAAERLRTGGLFITDNVICDGQIVKRALTKKAEVIMEFNRRLYNDPRFLTTILPLRDGLAVALRI